MMRQCRSATVKRVDCVRGAFRVTPCVCLTEAHNRLHGASDSLIVSKIQSFVLSWPLYSLCPKLWWRRNNRSRVFAVGCKRVTEGVPGWIEGLRLAPGTSASDRSRQRIRVEGRDGDDLRHAMMLNDCV